MRPSQTSLSHKYFPISNQASHPTIWMGTWTLGGMHFGPTNHQESHHTIQTAYELGIRHFDTAYFYAKGQSDRLLKPLCKRHRNNLFISSKGGLTWDGRTVHHDASPNALETALNNTLQAIGTDYLDLFSLHCEDPNTPWDSVRNTLIQFQQSGKIRFWGVSNTTVPDAIPHQIHFNPIHRDPAPTHSYNVAYSPLEQGLLSLVSKPLTKNDRRKRNRYFADPKVIQWLNTFRKLSTTPISSTLRWILAQTHIHALILGPRTPEQLQSLWKALHQKDDISDRLWDHLNHGPFAQ